jgi:hypothetical protein
MKRILYIIVAVLVASACSSPKYTASFNSWDKAVNHQAVVKSEPLAHEPMQIAQSEQLLASTSLAPVEIAAGPTEVRKTYIQMTKQERKALRTHLRSEVKTYVKEHKKNFGVESTQSTAALDNDLKLAAIFGAVGIVAMFIGGDVFYIVGAIALLVGVVFFVKWLVRQ